MWEPPFFGGFQGLWEEWDGFIVPRFPSARHFHRFGRRDDFYRARQPFRVAVLLTVGSYLWSLPRILLRFDQRQRMTESLVLDDGCWVDSLVLVEDPVGKRMSLPAHLQPAIREVVEINILAATLFAGWQRISLSRSGFSLSA